MTEEAAADTEDEGTPLSLEDILKGEAGEPAAEEPEPEGDEEPETDEDEGDEQPEPEPDTTGDEDDGPPPSADDKTVPLKALEAERSKRQELEARLRELEDKAEKESPLPDPLDDSEGFAKRLSADFDKKLANTRIELAQDLMRTLHDDYDVREAQFLEAVKESPELISKFQQASNPAKFAYETAVRLEKLAQLDNVEETEAAMRAKIEAQLRAEIQAEQEAKGKAAASKAKAVDDADMPSLARTGSGGVAEAENTLDQILGGADPSRRR